MSKISTLLGAVGTATLLAAVPVQVAQAQQPLRVTVDANSVRIWAGKSPVLHYRDGDVPFKPYVKELFTPDGINVLLDAPADHRHHHALMFACAVNNVDFWGEAPTQPGGHFEPQPGKQEHVVWDRVPASIPEGYRLARISEGVAWSSPLKEKPLLFEHRTITAGFMRKPKATVLTWASRLWLQEGSGSVTLSGSHYHGLGLRFIRSMDATGEFRNPDNDPGVVFRGDERLTRARWCAYTAQADGNTVTVAMFDHPENPRHPATWFTMAKPFAYMSATMRLHEEPLKVFSHQPLTLRYGVALWDGRPDMARIDELYEQWIAMLRAK